MKRVQTFADIQCTKNVNHAVVLMKENLELVEGDRWGL